ncbi:hypothetical protein CERSUDRAFT_93018 [Gelatoporia subvermispora B]|uniref:EngB-type G domain-containing protein n=1 Tax=Ceriporiopsis subvermispora (strain B) TaxID=914234 RepID=M2RKJ7_CERS8|nr:hypothetical protein CERSUDRAFT_93018 [Gelatoporia subvermispora B]
MFKATLPRCNIKNSPKSGNLPTTQNHSRSRTVFPLFQHPAAAQFLAAASTEDVIPELHGAPEVVFTGRENVGKSSLINLLVGRNYLAPTSKIPGRTQTLNFYRVCPDPSQLVLVDSAGYAARRRLVWGRVFEHYIQNRPQLKRVYTLFDIGHGLTEADKMMLQFLKEASQGPDGPRFTIQAVLTKVSWTAGMPKHLKANQQSLASMISEHAPTCLPPIITSTRKPVRGLDLMRQNILEAVGLWPQRGTQNGRINILRTAETQPKASLSRTKRL